MFFQMCDNQMAIDFGLHKSKKAGSPLPFLSVR